MGKAKRPQPKKLKRKLRQIRTGFKLTQEQIATQLKKHGAERAIHSGYVSDYETGKREPSLLSLLAYSRFASVSLETLVDDKLDLPRS